MRRKRHKQRALLLRKGDYCCDQAQFAAPSPARGDSSQKLFCPWTASNQKRHPERCKHEQSDGEHGEQPRPRFNLFDASFGEAEIPLGVAESLFNGLITNDKFCLTRWRELNLTWRRRPLRLRSQS
jgi:hypothetical protein